MKTLNILKILFLSIFNLLIGIKEYAQQQSNQEKIVVAIMPVSCAIQLNGYDAVGNVTNVIQTAFSGKHRFITVDRAKISDLVKERELQKNESFINGKMADQGKTLGADYIVTGNIITMYAQAVNVQKTNYTTNQKYILTEYAGQLNLSLNLTDVTTGSTKTKNLMLNTTGSKWAGLLTDLYYGTQLEALNAVTGKLSSNILSWINEIFPEELKIISVESTNKKGMPEKVLIKGGSESNLARKSKLAVYTHETITVDNQTLIKEKKIGELKVNEMQGSDLSVCIVTDGAEEIQAQLNAGKTLYLKITSY